MEGRNKDIREQMEVNGLLGLRVVFDSGFT